jgi:hypothetical protein
MNYPKNGKIINNIFQIKNGDVMQIYENNHWSDLGVISDARRAAVSLNSSNFTMLDMPARVIRR